MGTTSDRHTQEHTLTNRTFIRRGAPIAAALALGAGAGAGVYAGLSGGSKSAAPAATIPAAQQAAVKTTTTTLTQLYKNATPGVVDITVTSSGGAPDPLGGGGGSSQAEGSGFVVDTNGDIVTNEHVVDGATSIVVHFVDGKSAKATLVGSDPSTDIAVVKVNVAASELHPLTMGTSKSVLPGQGVIAIGSPFGLADSMTSGIVS